MPLSINGFNPINSLKASATDNKNDDSRSLHVNEFIKSQESDAKPLKNSKCNKISTYFSSKASFFGLKTIYGASWVAGKTAEYALFTSNKKDKEQQTLNLEEMTGSKELGVFINLAVSHFSEKIRSNFLNSGVLSYIIDSEKVFLNQTLEILITKMLTNVGKDLKNSELQENDKPLSPVVLMLHLSNLIQVEVKKLQQKTFDLKELREDEKQVAYKKASQEASLALLNILLPKGDQDLPLRSPFKGIFWDYLKNKIIPDLLISMASFSAELRDFSKIEHLKQNNDHQLVIEVIESCKSLISRQFENITEPSIATGISNAVLKNFHEKEAGNGLDLTSWLSNMLQTLTKQEDPLLIKFKNIHGNLVDTIFSHVFYKLLEGMPSGNDPIIFIVEKLLKIIAQFKSEHQNSIDALKDKLKCKNVDISKNEGYIACFKPLASNFMQELGLENMGAFLPKAIKPFMDSVSENLQETLLPKILAKYYDQFILPSVQLYENVLNAEETSYSQELKLLKGGDFLAKEGTRLKSIIVSEIPEYLIENQEIISQFGSQKVESVVSKIDQLINEFLIKKCNLKQVENVNLETPVMKTFSWVKPWISNKLNDVARNDGKKLLTLRFVESRIDAIFAHSIRAIYKKNRLENKDERGVSVEVIDDVLSKIGSFIDLNGNEIAKRYEEICHLNINPKDDKQFLELFTPLAASLYEMFGFNDSENLPIPDLFKPFLKDIFMDAVPLFFARRYHEFLIPKGSIERSKLTIVEILGQNDSAEKEKIIGQIDDISDILSEKLSGSLVESFSELTREGNSSESSEIKGLKDFNNRYFKDVVKSLVLQGFVNFLKKNKENQIDETLVLSGVEALASVINDRLLKCGEQFKEILAIEDPVSRKDAMSKALIPMSKDLCKLFGSEKDSDFNLEMPFQNIFKSSFKLIETKLIPDFLADLYLDKQSWKNIIEKNKADVLIRPNGKYIPESSKIIASYIGSYLPVYLYRDQEFIAEAVFSATKKYLNDTGHPKRQSIEVFLKDNESIIKKLFCYDLLNKFTPGNLLAKETDGITKETVELLLIKFFNGLSNRIDEKEGNLKNQDEFLVNLSIKLLSIANMHFKTINKISGKKQAFEVSHEEYLKGFSENNGSHFESGERLYPGIPKSETSLSADKKIASIIKILDRERARYARCKNRNDKLKCMEKIKLAQKNLRDAKAVQELERQSFIQPLTEFLLEIAGLSKPEDLPVPKILQEEIFNVVKDKLMPAILNKIYDNIIDPSTINALMLSGLVALNESLDSEPVPNVALQEVPKDEKQQRLNQVCGELILELLQQIPESYTRIVLKIDKLKKFTTESVGESVRRQLGENLNLAKIIEKGLLSGIASLHPGRWQEIDGNVKFIPGKWVDHLLERKFVPDQVGEGESADAIPFTFAMTDDQLEAEERKKIRAMKTTEAKMKNLMVSTAHRLTSDAFFYSLKAPFIYFLNLWNKAVDYVFGKYAPDVREFIKYNGESFIFKLMESFFSWIYKCITLIPWLFIDMHNSYKAEYFTHNMHLKIHENLALGLSNALMDSLRNNESALNENIMDSIIKAAVARDVEVEKERQAYLKHWKLNTLQE